MIPDADVVSEADLPVLASPAEGVPDVVDTSDRLAAAIAALASGTGPVAVDAERAQSYRYSSRAYLIQVRRRGAGTLLVDPIALCPADRTLADLSSLSRGIADAEWIIHAATQDLPCLVELELIPTRLFDTELAGRLLGFARVGLGTLIEQYFGQRLLKEHSAADWSSRPLPREWLNYAALDVELLIELRERMVDELNDAGKAEWAAQEFAWLAAKATRPVPRRIDPWRRTSGIHAVRTPTGLAMVRELWQARDEIAQRLDKAPGKILQDKAIAELAAHAKPGRHELRSIHGFQRRNAKRYEANWLAAIQRAQATPRSQLPPLHLPTDGPPPPRTWENRNPEAYARYLRMRDVMTALAAEHNLPSENLLTPDFWRRLAWQPPARADEAGIDEFLTALEARPWQRDLVVAPLTAALGAGK